MSAASSILVVDGSVPGRLATVRTLQRAGYPVSQATDGTQALREIRATKPSLVLLDVVMPDMTGHEVLRQVRADPSLADVSVILISSHMTMSEHQVDGLDAGAEGYIVRPVSGSELLARVHAHFRQRDLTDRLRASEQQFFSAFAYAAIGVALVAPDGLYLKVNRALCQMLGYTEEELLKLRFQDITHPADLQGPKDERRRLLAGEIETFQVEKRYLRKDGQVVWAHLSLSLVRDEAGEPLHLIAQIQDITERKQAESAGQRSLQRLVAAQRLGKIGDWEHDLASGSISWSPEVYSILGRDPALGVPRDFEETVAIYEPASQAILKTRIALAMETGEGQQYELSAVKPNGERVEVLAIAVPLRDDAGRVVGLYGTIQDITARKQSEAALRESETLFSTAFRSSPAAIAISRRRDLVNLEVNDSFLRLFECQRADIIGHTFLDAGLLDAGALESLHRRLLAEQSIVNEEMQLRTLSGKSLHIIISVNVIQLYGEPCAFSILIDITERKRSEARIAQQASLIDEARDAIFVRDLDDRVTFWSNGAERIFGWTAEEAVGEVAHDLLHMNPASYQECSRIVREAGEWHGETRKTAKNGAELTLDGRWTLVRDATGQPHSILTINTDITERKKLELQFLRAQRLESVGTLAGGIAHDLNNMLSPIIMALDLLKDRLLDPASQEILTIARGSAQRGADMVGQVLSFARGVEGRRMEVQIKHLLDDIEKITNDTFLKQIVVSTVAPADLWTVLGDPTQLHQVLLNLCVNARDAMPGGGALNLFAENLTLDAHYGGMNLEAKPGPYVHLQVEDTGTGIPPALIEKIFDPFFTTKDVGKGTGLGLSTSLAIVKSHGGFFRVYSEVGKGTKFDIYLPAQTAAATAEKIGIAPELPLGNDELILVIDDEHAVRLITQKALEAFGYRVLLASDGVEAVTLYASRREAIAVVLTAITMP
ncbi:PAS domain S-box protein, partial [bacterium]|nr:PAS domain S-box protein [bacterium]